MDGPNLQEPRHGWHTIQGRPSKTTLKNVVGNADKNISTICQL